MLVLINWKFIIYLEQKKTLVKYYNNNSKFKITSKY